MRRTRPIDALLLVDKPAGITSHDVVSVARRALGEKRIGHADTLAYEPWPTFDAALLVESTIEVPVQVNGKVRGKVTVAKDADQAAVEAAAKAHETIAANLAGKTIAKAIYVPGKLLNYVVK